MGFYSKKISFFLLLTFSPFVRDAQIQDARSADQGRQAKGQNPQPHP